MTLLFQRRCRMTDCSRWNVVRCHQGQMPPDASRQIPPGARCRQMPVARCPPGPAGAWGRSVEHQSWCPLSWSRGRAAAVSSGVPLVATMSDVLPPSSLGSHSFRCPLSNGFVPRSLSQTRPPDIHHLRPLGRRPRRLRSALLSPMRCPDFHRLRPLGHRSRRLRSANRCFRPWRPAAAADPLFPAPVRSRRRSLDPQISARGALAVAARLPQFWSIIYFNLCQ